MPPDPPAWCLDAARELYRAMESIDDVAARAREHEPDPKAGRETWCRLVAGVIARHAPEGRGTGRR